MPALVLNSNVKFSSAVFAFVTALACVGPAAVRAATPFDDLASPTGGQSLARVANGQFGRRVAEGLPATLINAVSRVEFDGPSSRAYRELVLRGPDARTRPVLKFKAHAFTGDALALTLGDGRILHLAQAHVPRAVHVNGRDVAWTPDGLERLVTELDHVLRRPLIAWSLTDLLLPRAEAAAPLFFVYSLAALVAYYAWDSYGAAGPTGTPGARADQRVERIVALCEAERADPLARFVDSETARTVDAIATERTAGAFPPLGQTAPRPGAAGTCEAEVLATADGPAPVRTFATAPSPDARLRCERAAHLSTCVTAFRARAGS